MTITAFWPRLTGRLALWLSGALAAAMPAAAQDDLKAPLAAEVRFTGAAGRPLGVIRPDTPFGITLEIRSPLGAVPDDLRPMAWLRQREPSDLPCGETAAAYRATGRAALGSVDLNGVVLGVAMRDGAFIILDPERALATANLLTARRFDPPPSAIAADAADGAFLLSLPGTRPGTGRVLRVQPYGQSSLVAEGLGQPETLLAAQGGGGWLLDRATGEVLRLNGTGITQRLALGARQISGDAGSEPTARIAVTSTDRLRVIESDASIALDRAAPGILAAALTDSAALWLGATGLHLIWLDAPDQPQTIPLPGSFDRIEVSPEGRMAFLFARDRTGFVIVDLALGRVVQGADTDSPVAEMAFLPGTAILRLADHSAVGVMDLREISPRTEAAIGRVSLGPALPPTEGATLLAPLLPEPALLAVHADSYTGFVIDARNAVTGKPPMEAMRLRGGIPQIVRALDRSLRQIAPGRFVAAARLPREGEWEIVVSVGVGQLAFCAALPTPPAPSKPADQPGAIMAQPEAGGLVRLHFLAADGTPVAGLSGTLDLAALTGNWRGQTPFTTDADGLTVDSYDLGPRLPLVITTRDTAQGGQRAGFAPFVMEEIR